MIDLDANLGPMRLRAWGLVANFLFNAVALYGLSRALTGNGGVVLLLVGGIGTLVCIAVVAAPSAGGLIEKDPIQPRGTSGRC